MLVRGVGSQENKSLNQTTSWTQLWSVMLLSGGRSRGWCGSQGSENGAWSLVTFVSYDLAFIVLGMHVHLQ